MKAPPAMLRITRATMRSSSRSIGLFPVSVAAGKCVGDFVHGFLRRALGLVDAPFVLQAFVSWERAGCLLRATFCLVDVLVRHGILLIGMGEGRLSAALAVAAAEYPHNKSADAEVDDRGDAPVDSDSG